MKRFHVHVSVEDIAQSVRFYAALFAADPTVVKPDYAKWMLDDPRVNFAISKRGHAAGVEHLGIQVEDEGELAEVYSGLALAERPVVKEAATTCCYANCDKQWIADLQGVAWETFLRHSESTVYGQERASGTSAAMCCEPAPMPSPSAKALASASNKASGCCGPAAAT